MYREPRICTRNNVLSKRWYVELIFNGKRLRYYNGKKIGLELYPNRSHDRFDRERLCHSLYNSIRERLALGWNPIEQPLVQEKQEKDLSLLEAGQTALNHKLRYPISEAYKRDLKQIINRWDIWVKECQLQKILLKDLKVSQVEDFLLQFNTGSTYYRTQRRTLSAVFTSLVNLGHIQTNLVGKTTQIKREESLHLYYNDEEIKEVLNFIKNEHLNLYLACLITYGCF
jgi:hypothetical protein